MATKTFTATKDAHMAKSTTTGFSGWNGHDDHLQVGAHNQFKVRSCVYFNIDSTGIEILNSATLRLTFSENANHEVGTVMPVSMRVARMTQDWGEGSIDPGEGNYTSQVAWDWDNRNGSWSTVNDVLQNVSQGSSGTTVDIDITDIFLDWVDGAAVNRGIILINVTSETTENRSLLFFSEDNSDPARRPKLIIDYETNVAPNNAVNASPTGNQVVNTLTPTFSYEMDDPDANDYITQWSVTVVTDDYTSGTPTAAQTMWKSGNVATIGQPTQISAQYGNPDSFGSLKPLVSGTFYKWYAYYTDKAFAGSPFPATLHRFKVNSVPNTPNVTIPTPVNDIADNTPTITIAHSDPDPADSVMHGYNIIVEQETTPGSGAWSVAWQSGDVDTSGSPVSTVQVTTGTLAWGGSFRVSARTKDSSNAWSAFSAWKTFATHKTATPVSLAPSGSETVSATPTLTGSRGSTTDTIISYSIRVFSDDLQTTMLAETNYTTGITSGATFSRLYAGSALTGGQSYQWQAKVESSIGGFSDWSALQRFTVIDASIPTTVSPVGETDYTLTPTITIDRVGTFNAFQFEIYPSTSTSTNLGTAHFQSGTLTSNIGAGGLGTRYSAAYSGTALTWDTEFKIRARVSSDGGSNWSSWSGLSSFRTDAAETPALTSVAGDVDDPAWFTDLTPDFIITRGGSDTIDFAQVRVWNENGTVLYWDSGLVNVTNATTATITYSGPTLSRDLMWSWDARYQRASDGATGPYAARKRFKVNSLPAPPTLLFPPPGHVYRTTDTKRFDAFFSDVDVGIFEDDVTEWEIEIQEDDETPFDTEVITTNISVGLNTVTWPGTALGVGGYRWRTRFKDSMAEWGPYSGWQIFNVSTPPNGTIDTPTNGSNLSSVTPTITWTYSGGTQQKYTITINETNSSGVFQRQVTELGPYFGTEVSRQIPAGHLKDTKYYDIVLTVWNTDGLVDPSPSSVNVRVLLDAPDPITGFVPTTFDELSLIRFEWDAHVLDPTHSFVAYRISKRLLNDPNFTLVADVEGINTTSYDEWYAGNTISYQYRIVAVTTKTGVGVEMESPDDPDGESLSNVVLDDDNWVLVGANRQEDNIYPLIVDSETHNRPIQQEVFETLGSSRKVIMRGFVLGHEGNINTLWQNKEVALPSDEQVFYNETVIGRRLVDYITFNPGPHILKSPFGDVWDVQFTTPDYQWQPAGHLSVSLSWIETGSTSQVSI